MNTNDFAGWWNWIFLAPFIVGALMVAITVFGIGDDDGGADDDGDDGAFDEVLEKLNLDGVPPLMLLQNFLLWFGVIGWSVNRMTGQNGPSAAPLAIGAAIVVGLVLTLATARFLAQFAPKGETAATHRNELEGRVGEATTPISSKNGEAFVRDHFGTLHQIAARVDENQESIARGQQVLVVAYDESDDRFRVKLWQDSAKTESRT